MMFWLTLFACGSPCEVSENPTLQVGSGTDTFVPLAAGNELTFTFGSQGGRHIELAFRTDGLTDDDLILTELLLTGPDDAIIGSESPWLDMRCNHDVELLEVLDVRMFPFTEFNEETFQYEPVPTQMTLFAELQDAAGNVVSTTLEVQGNNDPLADF